MPGAWSDQEVDETVASYLDMFERELREQPVVKTEYYRKLAGLLNGRSIKAVEYKFENISAVLRDLGLPFADGLKPYSNYQRRLYAAVKRRLALDPPLLSLIREQVEAPAVLPPTDGILDAHVRPPTPPVEMASPRWLLLPAERPPIDYVALEAQNASLGSAGEEFVMEYERARLLKAGKVKLAARIDRVSQSKGDWLGYDIKSFEESGRPRYIEVKTTAYGKRTQFYVTRNEVRVSAEVPEEYHLFRVFRFRQGPKLFSLRGSLENVCRLVPINYEGRVG